MNGVPSQSTFIAVNVALSAGVVTLARDDDDVGSNMLGTKISERFGAIRMADVFEDASMVVGAFVLISGRLRGGCNTSDEAIESWRAHPSRLLRPMLKIRQRSRAQLQISSKNRSYISFKEKEKSKVAALSTKLHTTKSCANRAHWRQDERRLLQVV